MATTSTHTHADRGFHAGELTMQRSAGVERDAAPLWRMLEPAALTGGIAGFLSERTFLVFTGRDAAGRLWTSALAGPVGFLEVQSETTVAVHAEILSGDPLHGLRPGQKIGMTAIEFTTRRRVRINGTLIASEYDLLLVQVEQAFGNCPKYIQQRSLAPGDVGTSGREHTRRGTALEPEDVDLIRSADTFFLGTDNPERGADASHRGGTPGFVRVDERGLWWPDYEGNNMFTSFGNLAVNPEAALLFFDFSTGRTLHLSGTSEIEWGEPGRPGDDGHTGRIARFTVHHLTAGHLLPVSQTSHSLYPYNPALTGAVL